MKIDILTIFPHIFDSYFDESILKNAQTKGFLQIRAHDIRKFTKNKHQKVDDTPYGGGAGMLMTPQPLYDCIQHVKKTNQGPVIYMSPKGQTLTSTRAARFSKLSEVILLCGRYEGIDQRIIDLCVDQEISIGKYVLTGGELAAMVFVDAVSRFIPGILGDDQSAHEDSFSRKLAGKKEYPHYTKPRTFKGISVPDVLLSGDHQRIANWKKNNLS